MVTVPTSISLSSSKLVGYGCSTESHETLAGRLGFEPRQVPPKGTVLPLDDRPALCSRPRVSLAKRMPVNPVLARAFHPSIRLSERFGSECCAHWLLPAALPAAPGPLPHLRGSCTTRRAPSRNLTTRRKGLPPACRLPQECA